MPCNIAPITVSEEREQLPCTLEEVSNNEEAVFLNKYIDTTTTTYLSITAWFRSFGYPLAV